MDWIPDEIWTEIILYLPVNDLLNFNITCSYFHKIVREYKITNDRYAHRIVLKFPEQLINYNFRSYEMNWLLNVSFIKNMIHHQLCEQIPHVEELTIDRIDQIVASLKNVTQLKLSYGLIYNRLHIESLTNLHSLKIVSTGQNLEMNSIINLTSLTTLKISHCNNITDKEISYLPNLINLCIDHCKNIENLNYLMKLEKLSLCYSNQINDISKLTSLYKLSLEGSDSIIHISKLSNLKYLKLKHCRNIGSFNGLNKLIRLSLEYCDDISIRELTNLTKLIITNNNLGDICPLIKLKKLDINNCQNISNINHLTNLIDLSITDCHQINDISNLLNLRKLLIYYATGINDNSIKHLINLERLQIALTDLITNESITHLTNLTKLEIENCENITSEIKLPKLKEFSYIHDMPELVEASDNL